jgi:hypothetical protein
MTSATIKLRHPQARVPDAAVTPNTWAGTAGGDPRSFGAMERAARRNGAGKAPEMFGRVIAMQQTRDRALDGYVYQPAFLRRV